MKKYHAFNSSEGFTLIELLVVMSIIVILSSVVLAVVNPARNLKRAEDAASISALSQCADAVEAWHIRHSPDYPDALNEMVPMNDLKVIPTACTYYSKSSNGENAWIATTLKADPLVYKCPTTSETVHYCYQTTTGTYGYICDGGNIFSNNLDGQKSCEAIANQAINGSWIAK